MPIGQIFARDVRTLPVLNGWLFAIVLVIKAHGGGVVQCQRRKHDKRQTKRRIALPRTNISPTISNILLQGDGMFDLSPALLLLLVLGGLLVLFGMGTLLFQAGCALADVPDRRYFRALPIYSAAVIVCLPLAAMLVWLAGSYDADPNDWFGSLRILALIASLPLIWLLSAGIYSLLLSASLRKGLLIAAVELLLMALLTALVTALVLVILAFVQITTRPPPKLSSLSDQPDHEIVDSLFR
jgi:hypothetical protein